MTRGRAADLAGVTDVDLTGRTAVVTGATSGIGRETALALGRLGASLVVHGRDRDRGADVVSSLRELGVEDAVFLDAEFTVQADVRRLAARIRDRVDAVDVLVNNAGAHFREGRRTRDGVERTFAVNHLAPFLLTTLLRPALAADGRVVTVSSAVHRRAEGSFEPGRVDSYDGLDAYSRSKLANVLFTAELARRLEGPTANCCHPGFVPGSAIWRDASLPVRLVTGVLGRLPLGAVGPIETPVTGAVPSVYLAASPAVEDVTGRYFTDCEPESPSTAARDRDLQRQLWSLSEELTGRSEG